MNCGMKTSKGAQCSRGVVSGLTLHVEDTQQVVYCCNQHYNMYPTGEVSAVWVAKSTMQVAINKESTMQEEAQSDWGTTNGIPNLNPHAQGVPGMNEIHNQSKEDTMKYEKEEHVPTSPIVGSTDRGHGWVKCSKCSKEIGENWYHPTVADLRTCLGAVPAPVHKKDEIVNYFNRESDGVLMASKWFPEGFHGDAVNLAKDVSGTIKKAKSGNGYWVTFEV